MTLSCVCNKCRTIFHPDSVTKVTFEAFPKADCHLCDKCLEEIRSMLFDDPEEKKELAKIIVPDRKVIT